MARRELHVHRDVPGLLKATADFLRDRINEVLSANAYCNIALSGGNTPRSLYAMLAGDPYRREISWERLRFFFGDERFVPHDHADSNFRMARESLFDPAGIDMKNVFSVNTSMSPAQAAIAYQDTIKAQLGKEGTFNIILLGLGDDAHTASLFPHTDVLGERSLWVKEVYVESLAAWRITFTVPLIAAAQTIVFLAHGASKAAAVKHVLEGAHDPLTYPAQFVVPVSGEVHWFLDIAAAGEVKT